MAHAPLLGVWPCCRPKLKPYPDGTPRRYYGAYPAGFLGPARTAIGCSLNDLVLHICGGMARHYPYTGFGPFDRTLELDDQVEADFHQDARKPWPRFEPLHGVLIDPPYDSLKGANYRVTRENPSVLPTPSELLRRAAEVLLTGRRVGILGWGTPHEPKSLLRPIGYYAILMPRGNRMRQFSVYERI